MSDQAQVLRGLVEKRIESGTARPLTTISRARTIAITSGKGGVGKSNIALNLAIALKQSGCEVCLLDANFGLGNIDLLCGLNGYWNLSHVISGVRTLNEIVLEGPQQIHVIPGASGLMDVADCPASVQQEILQQLESLEQTHDYLLIDTGTGIHRAVRRFISAANVVLVVTTPEPTAIADCYATIKAFSSITETAILEVLVNQVRTREEASAIAARLQQTARLFLHCEIGSAGFIPYDLSVAHAVGQQSPLLVKSPRCPASRAIEQLSRRVKNVARAKLTSGTFFSRLWRQ